MQCSHSQIVTGVVGVRQLLGVDDGSVGVDIVAVVVVNLQVFGVVPDADVEQERHEDADGREDGQVDPHLVDVVDEAVGLLPALVAPDGAGLVHDGADDEGRREDGEQRQHRKGQGETGSLKKEVET